MRRDMPQCHFFFFSHLVNWTRRRHENALHSPVLYNELWMKDAGSVVLALRMITRVSCHIVREQDIW